MAFTAIDDDDLVGFFTMRRPSESFDELRFGFVVVDPEKRGKGYGKSMLQLGVKFAKEIYGANTLGIVFPCMISASVDCEMPDLRAKILIDKLYCTLK